MDPMTESHHEHGRVLIVATPGPSGRAMEAALSTEGYPVTTVPSVYAAVARFATAPCEVVVLALAGLEERDLEIIGILREARPETYFLLSFPPDRRDLAVHGLSLGADAYLLEPFYLSEFLDLVRRGFARLGTARAPEAGPAPPPEAPAKDAEEANDLARLAGAVSHAVNNPLQIMEFLLSESACKDAGEFREEMARIHAMAEELLAFSQRHLPHRAPLDLNALLREAIPERPGPDGEVLHRLARALPQFAGDQQLRYAFAVLARTASIRGAPASRCVVESAESFTGGHREIVIYLRFPDLLLSRQERETFFRAFVGPLPGVVGLAAATAYAIIAAHGGSVEIDSRSVEGTVITIRLPLRPEAPPAGEAHA